MKNVIIGILLFFCATVITNAQDTIVSYYTFDGGTDTTIIDTITGKTGELANGATTVDGILSKGLSTSAADSSQVLVADTNSTALEFGNGPFTISLWTNLNPDSTGPKGQDEQVFIIKGDDRSDSSATSNGNWIYLGYQEDADEFVFAIDDKTTESKVTYPDSVLANNSTYTSGDWFNLISVRDTAKDSLFIYFDGTKVASILDNTGTLDLDSLSLSIGNSLGKTPVNGVIDELKFFNYALSQSEITAIYEVYDSVNITPVVANNDSALIAISFENYISGSTVKDDQNIMSGTLSDSAIIADSTDFGNSLYTNKDTTGALVFEDSEASSLNFNTTSFSISFLTNFSPDEASVHDEQVFLIKGIPDTSNTSYVNGNWYSINDKKGKLRFAIDDSADNTGGGKTQLEWEYSNYTNGAWAHVVSVRDREMDSLYIYFNGNKVASMADTTTGDLVLDNTPLVIGNNADSERPINGNIDEIKFYDKVLSPEDIMAMTEAYLPYLIDSIVIIGAVDISVDNDTVRLSKEIYPDSVSNKTLAWSSSDITIAKVNTAGLVQAVGNGTVTISATATDGKGTVGSVTMTMSNQFINVYSISVEMDNPDPTRVPKDSTRTLTLTIDPPNAAYQGVTWSSSNKTVATVSSSGVVSGHYWGYFTIFVVSDESDDIKDEIALLVDKGNNITLIENNALAFYPNPAEGQLFIPNASAINSIEILDLSGKVELAAANTNSEIEINISQLKAGMYVIRAYSTKTTYTTTFIKK